MVGSDVFDDVAFYYVATAFIGTLVGSITLYKVLSFISTLVFGSDDILPAGKDAKNLAKTRELLLSSKPAEQDKESKKQFGEEKNYPKTNNFFFTHKFFSTIRLDIISLFVFPP